MKQPPAPKTVGKRGTLKVPPNGELLRFTVIDEITRFQSDLESKVICLQRLRFDDGREEVRLGYYVIGKLPRMRGRWVWGQFATLVPLEDFASLVHEARRRRWFS